MTKKITFTLAPEIAAEATDGILLGDFNNWIHESGIKLKKQKDGSFKATVNLEPGVYQYRYYLNDGRWVNDRNASGYAFNGVYGVENCVVHVPFEEVKETVATGELVADIEVKPKRTSTRKGAEPKSGTAEKSGTAKKTGATKAVSKKPTSRGSEPAKKSSKNAKAL